MNPPTGRLQPRRVGKTWYKWQKGGNPWKKIPPQGMEIPNLPMHAYGHMGEKTGKQPGSQQKQQWSQILLNSENRGESLAKCWKQGSERPNPPTHSYRHRGGGRDMIRAHGETDMGQEKSKILANKGEPLTKRLVTRYRGGWTHASTTPIPLPA